MLCKRNSDQNWEFVNSNSSTEQTTCNAIRLLYPSDPVIAVKSVHFDTSGLILSSAIDDVSQS